MLIGFVLLISSCGFDACDALPVTDDIYPTQSECQAVSTRLQERKPNAVLMCSEVYR